jgi:hypothetical protein
VRIREYLARFGAATVLALGPFGAPASPAAAAGGPADVVTRPVAVADGRSDAFGAPVRPHATR